MNPPKRLRTTGDEEEKAAGRQAEESSAVDVVGGGLTLPYTANSDRTHPGAHTAERQRFGCGILGVLENTYI